MMTEMAKLCHPVTNLATFCPLNRLGFIFGSQATMVVRAGDSPTETLVCLHKTNLQSPFYTFHYIQMTEEAEVYLV